MSNILVIGANGQLGSELTTALSDQFGTNKVIASDKRPENNHYDGPFEALDALDAEALLSVVKKHNIKEIYHLAAILSARGEDNPQLAWQVNMQSLLNVLEVGRARLVDKIYWPSSIAVFGPDTPSQHAPQNTIMNPSTVYGISKLAGERWCEYYYNKFGVDTRSLRYPGLIGYKTKPGGGTTDYAVDIFYKALSGDVFDCFLDKDTQLPMMYMKDAIRATIDLMSADAESISVRSSYNVTAMSFSPEEIYQAVKVHYPKFEIVYNPDFRQAIANSWPDSINDQQARKDWGWSEQYNLEAMTDDIIKNLKPILK